MNEPPERRNSRLRLVTDGEVIKVRREQVQLGLGIPHPLTARSVEELSKCRRGGVALEKALRYPEIRKTVDPEKRGILIPSEEGPYVYRDALLAKYVKID
jgi:hypothetical protein